MSLCWKCKVGLRDLGLPKEEVERACRESSKRETLYCSHCGRQRKPRKGQPFFDYHTVDYGEKEAK